MKNPIIVFLVITLLSSCKNDIKRGKTFSPLIEYQHLIHTISEFTIPVETYKIRYMSDGLEITGYLSRNKDDKKYPTIIFNRGGNRNLGTHTFKSMFLQQYLASNGFNVLSTQLRGNMYSEGQDEFGGADLNDILQLIEINKTLKFANQKIGVLGISRGGLNTYQISRLTDDINAIVVIGAPTDLRLDFDTRPDMYNNLLKELVGDTIQSKDKYDYRSPLKWVEEINEPTLILHGSEDSRVKPLNAELMIEKMKALEKEFDYLIIEDGDHTLLSHRKLRNEKIVSWFKKYLS